MAVAAAAAGKHVICTKPLAAYVGQDLGDEAPPSAAGARDRRRMLEIAEADARAMVDAAAAKGVRLMYGENWVYAPAVRRARELLQASGGSILEMRGEESHSGSHSPYSKVWRHAGGGAVIRLAAHPLGAMLLIKREEGLARSGVPIQPVTVTAEVADLSVTASRGRGPARLATGYQDVENWGCVIVTFEDGSRGVARGSDNLLGGMRSHLRILASNCHLECNLSPHDLLRAYAPDAEVFGDAYIMEKSDSSAGWSTPLPDEDWTSGHRDMCRDFVHAVAEDRPPIADGELGLAVTRVVYAAYLSAAEGRRVSIS
jgi:predicted dehydrogenase